MKHRWLVSVLCALLLVVLLATSAPPPAGAGQPKAPSFRPTRLHPQVAIDPAAPSLSVPLAAQGWTTLLSEDFEGSFPGSAWTLDGDPTWSRTTYRAHGGSASAYCAGGGSLGVNPPGPYPEDVYAWIIAGPFDLSQATEAELSFAHWTETEPDEYDLFAAMATADGENWNGPSWSGDLSATCGGWCSETFQLSDFPGLGNLCGQPQVWIGFAFYSDSTIFYEGTYVDDIVLRASGEAPTTATPTATATNTLPPGTTPTATPTATATERPGGPSRVYLPVLWRSAPRVASKVVRTNEEATIQHGSGASLYIPRGAVPKTAAGQDGEMLFVIEKGTAADFSVPGTPPSGYQFAGGMFSLGPEGFTFAQPIELSLPVPAGATGTMASIFEYDRTAGQWKDIGGTVSRDGGKISAAVQDLNSVTVYGFPTGGCSTGPGEKGAGAIEFQAVAGYSFQMCIESFTLKYPEYDRNFSSVGRRGSVIRRDSPQCPADGLVYWILPQGDYTIAVEVYIHRVNDRPPDYLGYFERSVSITQPHYDYVGCAPGNFWNTAPFGAMEINPNALTAGRAPCMGAPTPSVGIGSLNVRLEWSLKADLDLWVIDPCGNKIYYLATQRTCQGSVGRLDLDNTCGGVVGRPENIFWASNPPRGTYKVYVDYFNTCGVSGAVPYTVRWWIRGAVNSARGTISAPSSIGAPNDEVLVATFTY